MYRRAHNGRGRLLVGPRVIASRGLPSDEIDDRSIFAVQHRPIEALTPSGCYTFAFDLYGFFAINAIAQN